MLTTLLVTGSGELFTASLTPVFTPCETSAVDPPRAAMRAWSMPVASPAANSMANITPATRRTSVRPNASGTVVVSLNLAKGPSISTVA